MDQEENDMNSSLETTGAFGDPSESDDEQSDRDKKDQTGDKKPIQPYKAVFNFDDQVEEQQPVQQQVRQPVQQGQRVQQSVQQVQHQVQHQVQQPVKPQDEFYKQLGSRELSNYGSFSIREITTTCEQNSFSDRYPQIPQPGPYKFNSLASNSFKVIPSGKIITKLAVYDFHTVVEAFGVGSYKVANGAFLNVLNENVACESLILLIEGLDLCNSFVEGLGSAVTKFKHFMRKVEHIYFRVAVTSGLVKFICNQVPTLKFVAFRHTILPGHGKMDRQGGFERRDELMACIKIFNDYKIRHLSFSLPKNTIPGFDAILTRMPKVYATGSLEYLELAVHSACADERLVEALNVAEQLLSTTGRMEIYVENCFSTFLEQIRGHGFKQFNRVHHWTLDSDLKQMWFTPFRNTLETGKTLTIYTGLNAAKSGRENYVPDYSNSRYAGSYNWDLPIDR